jgi:hypothetical protein
MSSSFSFSGQPHAPARRKRSIMLLGLLLFIVGAAHQPAQAASLQAQTFSISGRVNDGFGNGIGGATVTLSGSQAGVATTDAGGNYSFNDLPAGGNYSLAPSKAGGQYIAYGAVANNLSSNQTVNLRLDQYITVAVRVTDAAGHGVGDVEIKINNFSFSLGRTSANGTATLSVTIAMTSSSNPYITLTLLKPGYTFSPPSANFSIDSGSQTFNAVASVSTTPTAFIQFGAPSFIVGEGDGSANITVTRTGDTSSAASVSYFTGDAGVATQKSDYTMATGTLNFAPGETSKSFRVFITDNAYVQGLHTLFLQLGPPTGSNAVAGSPTFVTLSIVDNDTQTPTTNPLDDARFFVRQHYYDFLNRLPDQGGLDYWSGQIAGNSSNTPPPCPAGDKACEQSRRVGVTAAFFVENEFQQTGYVVYRLHRAALGLLPDYSHFMVERGNLAAGPELPQSTINYTNEFVERGIFKQFYPDTMTPEQFVNKLFDTAGLVPFNLERQQKIQDMTAGGKTRAQVLLEVIELPAFKEKEYNPAFVTMQYYGYLRRNPDSGGYQFWLDVLNSRVPNNYRAMVCAFITSAEYQQRFSSVVTHTNSECGP